MYDFLIVGAGVSGCLAAKKLSEASRNVLLLEKSRGPGGRMSSRRIDSPLGQWRFDHGAQFFTARDSRFQALISESAVCRPWLNEIPHMSYEKTKTSERWIGAEGMNSLVKEWAAGLKLHTEERVIKLETEDFGWKVLTDRAETYQTKHLVLSCPIPQCVDLLAGVVELPTEISQFSYEPCWTVLFGANEEFRLKPPYAFWLDSKSGIDWVCDNQKKGISELPALTIQLTADKTKELLNSASEEVIRFAKNQIQDFLPDQMAYEAAHRWLYAAPISRVGKSGFYRASSPAPFSIIGDAFYGGRVEGAALSAFSLLESAGENYVNP